MGCRFEFEETAVGSPATAEPVAPGPSWKSSFVKPLFIPYPALRRTPRSRDKISQFSACAQREEAKQIIIRLGISGVEDCRGQRIAGIIFQREINISHPYKSASIEIHRQTSSSCCATRGSLTMDALQAIHDTQNEILNAIHTLTETILAQATQKLISIGYFLSDLAMIFWTFPALGGMEYVLHHGLSMFSIFLSLVSGQGQVYILMVLFTESTTPFVNLRWYLDIAGQKNSKLYVCNGVALFFGWLAVDVHAVMETNVNRSYACQQIGLEQVQLIPN
ncbi:TRAM, LAG1 and CLN8 (TLC) lipid-sensing domain containing protein [Actinidia rufa]|uniref:TRAM, LAG1 and CLN8 (TLC) lipid-sensing domain containing protein n=1 Tax=Actinidia rufa TaxID=165716 RepID=A0A7J0FL78_9ERIC|nr:TRAM, LAG1 and CLN8 (TLC) lipid-sensing domain containing protein [Actinidia rufa]